MIRLTYMLAGILIAPLLSLWLLKRAARGKEDRARLRERSGHAGMARPAGKLVWLHAASVGEMQSALTLMRALLDRYDDLHLLITTGTVTSARLLADQKLGRVLHQYVPLDTYPAVRRFMKHWQPDLVLWVESEFWPQLLWQLKSRKVPALLINARLSARSYTGWKRYPWMMRTLLSCFSGIYAGSAEDAERLRDFGAKDVLEVGNLKYDAAILPTQPGSLRELNDACNGRVVWLAASTHANEEQKVAEAHTALVGMFPNLLTIIVPRHATRGDAIAADLRQRGHAVAQRSKREPITPTTAIYLADTMGELGTFYRLSGITFLGGSLVSHGGQNPLEPARLNCAIITGPHTHNFAAIVVSLKQAEALREVASVPELASAVSDLLNNEENRRAMAARAAVVVNAARGASTHILQAVTAFLERP